jgi:hypothetical protein
MLLMLQDNNRSINGAGLHPDADHVVVLIGVWVWLSQ